MADAHELAARALQALGQAVVCTDADGRVLAWNARAEHLLGWTAAEAVGRPLAELAVGPVEQPVVDEVVRALRSGRPWTGTLALRRRGGTVFTALVSQTGLYDAGGGLEAVVGVVVDLGDVVRPYLLHASEAALVVTADGVVRFASPAVEPVFGWPDGDLVGRPLRDVVHPADRSALDAVDEAFTARVPAPVVEARVLTGTGGFRWVEMRWVDLRDDPGVRGRLCTLRDVHERHLSLDRLADLALKDQLTGLPNRAVLVERITHAVARRSAAGAVLFLDLDDFKAVNDTLGHACGDRLLQVVAQRLLEAVRPEDTCGRFGGDEFVVLAETVTSRPEAEALGARIAAAVRRPAELDGAVVVPQVSIGVALLADGHTVDHVLGAADGDMYRVKAGRPAARPSPVRLPESGAPPTAAGGPSEPGQLLPQRVTRSRGGVEVGEVLDRQPHQPGGTA